ncbi:hypothetical protein POTOM_030472 [Populus tomentosa]|uniref:2-phytyl-1,4-beta-naphthoquinone methyltransferase, chloroplastic n=1 Tax=Populus tomentosa TaxID=118781 RepID=A0A8X7Z8S5_POPTO|nr:hypothetical protein POTOM_030472 [Populus tomentosa]
MASLQLQLSFGYQSSSCRHLPISTFSYPSIRCANDRQLLFNRIAPVYDNLNDLLSLGQHRIWKRMAVSWTGAKLGDCVLDLCCGSGDLAFLLSEKVGSNGKVSGLDFSKEQLLMASSRQHLLSKACYKNIEWIEGDATDLPFPDCCFDAITMGYGLRNVVDKRKAVQEMFRVLKPGSKASVLDFNKSTQPFVASFQVFICVVFTTNQHLMKSILLYVSCHKEWMIDNAVVPVATAYGLAKEYEYLKGSIREYLTGIELEELALEAGFSTAKHYEISGGLMGNLVATR